MRFIYLCQFRIPILSGSKYTLSPKKMLGAPEVVRLWCGAYRGYTARSSVPITTPPINKAAKTCAIIGSGVGSGAGAGSGAGDRTHC